MRTYPKQVLKSILFLDIETVSCVSSYQELDDALKPLWDKKAAIIRKTDQEKASDLFFEKAAIYAEFGKVIVIGLGIVTFDEHDVPTLRVKALNGHDEKALLQEFKEVLETSFQQDRLRLCAHNGKEFDFPYLCRRMLVHGIPLPRALDIAGKKPWEVAHLDTMELWKFGDRKSFTPLHLLAILFGISSSKELMEGSKVNHYYYTGNNLGKIAAYCLQDVVVTAQLFLKMNCWKPIQPVDIVFT
ncbi:MAG TPA: 3'-5' exonuclease [Amoebophilaceae bacterium]|nr:3'-5' exonuclease [Amoebophilaceae bacterium]